MLYGVAHFDLPYAVSQYVLRVSQRINESMNVMHMISNHIVFANLREAIWWSCSSFYSQ